MNSQSIPGSQRTRVEFDLVEYDHGGWDSSNNEYVIPRDGIYRFDAHRSFKSNFSSGTFLSVKIERTDGGTDADLADHQETLPASGGNSDWAGHLSRTISAIAGAKIHVPVYQTDGEHTLEGTSTRHFFDNTQVG